MSNITWQFQAAIPGGPAFAISQPPIAVQAYDVASATIATGASNIDINVQPSSTVGDVVFVAGQLRPVPVRGSPTSLTAVRTRTPSTRRT